MDLTRDRWNGSTPAEREAIARRIAGDLPAGFTFTALRSYRMGDVENSVAHFRNDRSSFVLVPGGIVEIGYDADRPWTPDEKEAKSWERSSAEYGLDKNLRAYLGAVTTRRRRVELTPLLVETELSELGWEPIGLDDPRVQEILEEYGGRGQVEVDDGEDSTRIRKDESGTLIAERSQTRTHGDLAAFLAAGGYRFPTPDEWEYICGGGAPTLFRWGDHAPCDRYPTDASREELKWRRDWVLSGGTLERPEQGFVSDWDHHHRPSATGVLIASNPYQFELTSQIGVTRGGDGGCNICGGAGFFLGWLTLATAFFEEHSCRHDPLETVDRGFTFGRRVLALT